MDKEKIKIIKNILYAILVLILIACNIGIFVINHTEKEKESNNSIKINKEENYVPTSEEEIDEIITNKVSKMGERSRMQTYIGEFISYINAGNYEKSYNYLSENFRNNYFKTIDDFKKYVAENYPLMMTIEYNDIERRGRILCPLYNHIEYN